MPQADSAAATPIASLGCVFMAKSFASSGRRSAAQNEQNPAPLQS